MRITKKVAAVGHGLGILIDKPFREKLGIKKGDFVELTIKKVED